MAWDPDRPVPWRRLFTFVGIYSLVVLAIFAVIHPNEIVRSVPGVVFGGVVAVSLMAALTKFGWNPTMLKSKADIAEARAQRAAARAKPSPGRGAASPAAASRTEEPRPKPPPTRRTSTGRTNNPRRTRDTRKR